MSFWVVTLESELHSITEKQIYRYMGMHEVPAEGELPSLLATAMPRFLEKLQCKACWCVVPIQIDGERVDMSVMSVRSGHLARNLSGCEYAVMFAATLGMATERQRIRAAAVSPVEALILDALGSAAIEQFCDQLCGELAKQFPRHRLRPRFSPGYGDFAIEVQEQLLRILDAGRRIGIAMSDSGLMIPQKSVTAIVGLASNGCTKSSANCDTCSEIYCEFRL